MTDVDALISELRMGSPEGKQQAIQKLTDVGEEAIQRLVEAVANASVEYIKTVFAAIDWEQDAENQEHENPFTVLRDMLEHEPWFIAAVSHILERLGSASVKPLLPLLQNPSPEVRSWAAYTLGIVGDKSAVPAILPRLDTSDDAERIQVIRALGKLQAVQAVEKIIGLLDHEDTYTQHEAAEALGAIGDARAIKPLILELRKCKHNVFAVSAAIGQFGESVVEPLIELLSDETAHRVHGLVIMELWMIGDARAIEPIISVLEGTQNPQIQSSAVQALGLLKAKQAVKAISQILFTTENIDLRFAAAQAIAKAGGREAYDTLVEAAKSSNFEVKHCAILAIGVLEDAPNIDITLLLDMLRSENPYLKSASAIALGHLGDKQAINALIAILDEPDWSVQKSAIFALGKIGASEVIPLLEKKLESEEQGIRLEAQEALNLLNNLG